MSEKMQCFQRAAVAITNVCNENIEKIIGQMKRLGADEGTIDEWGQSVTNELSEVFNSMMEELKQKEQKLEEEIVELLQEAERLCVDLRIPLPKFGQDKLPLFQEKLIIKKQVQVFRDELQEKKQIVTELNKKEVQLCKVLGMQPIISVNGPVPTPDEIISYEAHIEKLEELRFQRAEEFILLKEEIVKYTEHLKYKPRLLIEQDIMSEKCSKNFETTEEAMEELRAFKDRLKRQWDEVNLDIEEQMGRLMRQWEILEKESGDITLFMNSLPGCAIQKLKVLQKEVKKCDAKIKKNIEIIVQKLREEIVNLWRKCRYSQRQCNEFNYFNDSMYCEDLLHHHELEISKLNKYYEQHKNIFSLLEKRDSLWSKKLELEKAASSQDRYKNRGGKLLQEEKERNAVLKQLATMELKLVKISEDYQKNGLQPLLVNGESIETYLNKGYEQLEQERKELLSAKKEMAKSSLSIAASRFGGSTLCLRNASSKRKLYTPTTSPLKRSKLTVATPRTEVPKRPRVNQNSNAKVTRTVPKLIVTKHNGSVLRKSFEDKRRRSQRMNKLKSSLDTTMEYDEFQSFISKKENCRSSTRYTKLSEFSTPQPLSVRNNNNQRVASKRLNF